MRYLKSPAFVSGLVLTAAGLGDITGFSVWDVFAATANPPFPPIVTLVAGLILMAWSAERLLRSRRQPR